jgi:predicted O-methyltransferase YrrM
MFVIMATLNRVRPCATTLESEVTKAEMRALLSLIADERLSGKHLEIGTAAGGTLCALMAAYPAQARPSFVVVDPMTYFANQLQTVHANLRGNGIDPAVVDFRVSSSDRALRIARQSRESFDFVFIDGNHKAGYVIRDLGWASLVRPGGFLCMHDNSPGFPGVQWAAKRFLSRNGQYYEVLASVDSLLIMRKIGCSSGAEVTMLDKLVGSILSVAHSWRRSARKRFGSSAGASC